MSDEVVVGEDGEYGVPGLCGRIAVSCPITQFQNAHICKQQYAIIKSFCEAYLWDCSGICTGKQGKCK